MLIERQSVVAAPAEQVWQRVVTPEGINDELRPWMTMSVPRGAKGMTVDTVPIGAPIGRAWLRLFGVLPFDYDRLSIAELEPGRRFREDSTMLSMRQWQHERTVTPEGDTKTIVRDRITFQTRAGLRFAAPLIAAGLRALFGHRHRRLQRHFAQGQWRTWCSPVLRLEPTPAGHTYVESFGPLRRFAPNKSTSGAKPAAVARGRAPAAVRQ